MQAHTRNDHRRHTTRAMRTALVPGLLMLSMTSLAHPVAAQAGAEGSAVDVSAAVTVTNKGISTIPSFTLGRPATIVDLAVRRGKVGFEPQLRFGLDGRPWSFLLWARYRPVTGDRFSLTLGAHPAFAYRTVAVAGPAGGRSETEVRRFAAGDVAPTYRVSKRVSFGGYYLYSHGLDRTASRHTHFVAARTSVRNIDLAHGYTLEVAPQIYYLRTAGRGGVYVGSGVAFGRRGVPVSISTTVNQPLRSEVPGGQGFLWNISITYASR